MRVCSSVVEHSPDKTGVGGSIPPTPTTSPRLRGARHHLREALPDLVPRRQAELQKLRAVSSVVERFVDIEEVTGSIPVPRTADALPIRAAPSRFHPTRTPPAYPASTHMKKKVQDIIDSLNKATGNHWVAASGVHALTNVSKDEAHVVSFNPGRGLPVKVFMNQETNEIRLYPALMFEDAF